MAAGRDMTARLILTLQDRISSGLGALQRRLAGLAGIGRRIGLAGGLLGALSFAGPVQSAALLETGIRDVAITMGATGRTVEAQVEASRMAINRLAREYRLLPTDVLAAQAVLSGRGMDPTAIQQFMPLIAEVGAASGTALDQLAQVVYTFHRTLGITGPEQMRLALAKAFVGGQRGGFELRDMAQFLPGLATQSALLGTTGMRAVESMVAQLQVMRDGFGTVAEAGAGAQQLYSHLLSESTQKNLRDAGIDLVGVFRNAKQLAESLDITPVEALAQAISRATRGNPEKLFELMPDQNSRQALAAWLEDVPRFLALRQELRRTDGRVLTQALTDRNRGLGADNRLNQVLVNQLSDRFGNAMGPALIAVNAGMGALLGYIAAIDARFPGLIDKTVSWGSGLLLLAGALGVIARVLSYLGAGLRLLLVPLRIISIAFAVFRAVLIALGIIGAGTFGAVVAAVVAIGAAAFVIWRNWDRLGPFFRETWETVKGLFNSFVAWVDGWTDGAMSNSINWLKRQWQDFADWFHGIWGPIAARMDQGAAFRQAAEAAGPPAAGVGQRRFGSRAAGLYGAPSDPDQGERSRRAGEAPGPWAAPREGGAETPRFWRERALWGSGGAGSQDDRVVRLQIESAPEAQVRVLEATPGVAVEGIRRGAMLARP